MKSWRTTASGIVTAICAFVLFAPEHFAKWPVVVDICKYLLAGGLLSMGLSSKDAVVHSTVEQTKMASLDTAVKAIKTDPVLAANVAGHVDTLIDVTKVETKTVPVLIESTIASSKADPKV